MGCPMSGMNNEKPPRGKKIKTSKNIFLTFKDAETADYVKTVCRRKGITLESYILDNFEWDDKPLCFYLEKSEKITHLTCEDCDYIDRCPDRVTKCTS